MKIIRLVFYIFSLKCGAPQSGHPKADCTGAGQSRQGQRLGGPASFGGAGLPGSGLSDELILKSEAVWVRRPPGRGCLRLRGAPWTTQFSDSRFYRGANFFRSPISFAWNSALSPFTPQKPFPCFRLTHQLLRCNEAVTSSDATTPMPRDYNPWRGKAQIACI